MEGGEWGGGVEGGEGEMVHASSSGIFLTKIPLVRIGHNEW